MKFTTLTAARGAALLASPDLAEDAKAPAKSAMKLS